MYLAMQIIILSLIASLIFMIFIGNIYGPVFATDSHNEFCYDKVGDGHPCFDTSQKCTHKQKHDDTAESPCYKDGN